MEYTTEWTAAVWADVPKSTDRERIAELEDILRRVLADEWTVLHQDIEDAARAVLAKKA